MCNITVPFDGVHPTLNCSRYMRVYSYPVLYINVFETNKRQNSWSHNSFDNERVQANGCFLVVIA